MYIHSDNIYPASGTAKGSPDPMRREPIMAKKNNRLVIDSMTVWNAQKPRFNGFACGHGAHGKRGYNRNAEKRRFRNEWA